MEQVVADGGLFPGERGHHGAAEVVVAAPGDAGHQAGHSQQRAAAEAGGKYGIGGAHPNGGDQDSSAASDRARLSMAQGKSSLKGAWSGVEGQSAIFSRTTGSTA